MLQSIEEVKKADLTPAGVINGVDNANLLSVDSTAPVMTDTDELKKEDDRDVNAPVEAKKEEVKETKKEVKKEEKKEEKPEEQLKIQKRIDEITKNFERDLRFEKTKSAKIEAEHLKLKEELKTLQAKLSDTSKPKKEDFEDVDDYVAALAEWTVNAKLANGEVKEAAEVKKDNEEPKIDQDALDLVIDEGIDKYKDFKELVFSPKLTLTPKMLEIVLELEVETISQEDILYYLAKNPERSAEIAQMSPVRITRAFSKIENELAAEKEKNEKKEEKPSISETPAVKNKFSKAPEPIDPPKAGGVSEKDPANMSMKEYRLWREQNK
jgi:hypothetical protein